MKHQRSVLSMGMMELVGTAILVGTIQAVKSSSPEQGALAVFALLIGLIYIGFELSGAHYNPVVTLTFVLRGKCTVRVAAVYTGMQVLGGYIGAVLTSSFSLRSSSFAVGPGYTWSQAAMAELFFTTVLCFSVLTIALRHATDPHPVFGIAIAGIVLGGALTAGPISGASFNPAVSIALSMGDRFNNMRFALFTSVFNIMAAAVASLIFYVVAPEELSAIKFLPPVSKDEDCPLLGVPV